MLYHNVAVNEVGPHPRWVEDRVRTVQERNAHNVITNVTFLVYLCVCVGGGGGRRGEVGRLHTIKYIANS